MKTTNTTWCVLTFIYLTSRFLNEDFVLIDLIAVSADFVLEDTCWSSMLILDYIELGFLKSE